MSAFFGYLSDMISAGVLWLLSLLPKSPFVYIEASPVIAEYLGYFNFFIPVSAMVAVFVPWLLGIAIYYVASVALRWLKAIE